jgi:hypothetical protein
VSVRRGRAALLFLLGLAVVSTLGPHTPSVLSGTVAAKRAGAHALPKACKALR